MALVSSLGENRLLGMVSQIDPREDSPGPKDLYEVGTVAMIHKIVRMKEGHSAVLRGYFAHAHAGVTRQPIRTCARKWNGCPNWSRNRRRSWRRCGATWSPFFSRLWRPLRIFRMTSRRRWRIPTNSGVWRTWWPELLPGLSHPERQAVLEQLDVRARARLCSQASGARNGADRAAQ